MPLKIFVKAKVNLVCFWLLLFVQNPVLIFWPLQVEAADTQMPQRLAPPLAEQALRMTQSEHAEVLYSVHKTQLFADGKTEQIHYYSIRVLDEAAVQDYQTVFLPYNSDTQLISLDFAHIYQPETQQSAAVSVDISEQILKGDKPLPAQRNELSLNQIETDKALSLFARSLKVDDIIEFQYRIKSQAQHSLGMVSQTVSPYWLQIKAEPRQPNNLLTSPLMAIRADLVQQYRFELISPKSVKVKVQALGEHKNITPSVNIHKNQKSTQWQLENLAQLTLHNFVPNTAQLFSPVKICAFCRYSNVQTFYNQWQLVKPNADSLQSFIEKLKQSPLYQSAHNKNEKLKAVYAYVRQQIVFQPSVLSSHSFLPVSAEQVILARHGNDKDITQLIVEILTELEIQAEFAWLDLQAIPLQQTADITEHLVNFDQAIVYIPEQSGLTERWLDPSSELIYPGMAANLVGHSAAVFSKEALGIQFKSIQVNALPANVAKMMLDYYPGSTAQRKIQLELNVQGWFEQYFRTLANQDNMQINKNSQIEQKLLALFNAEADIELDYKVEHLASDIEPLTIKATYLFNQPKSIYTAGVNSAQMFNFLSNFNALPLPQQATSGYQNKLSYQAQLQAKFMAYPERIASLYQSSISQKSPYFKFTQQGEYVQNDYLVHFKYQQPALKLANLDYQAYLREIQGLSQLDAWLISFRLNPEEQAQKELKNALAQLTQQSDERLLAKAEYAISQSQFEQAIALAQQVLNENDRHAKAWYILATALGFNGELKAAKAAFNQAEKFDFKWEPKN
ncbi:DUF3857 domain-containing protein [Catenovulum adriaticum]|uniref:DUF3857 domain-containing protein n=1 Tax=Catenovulum adriaticum TaxID=2984846 RepID=A0ABY7AKP7_9ALTE|nr:DUF3857 domain-containing protein [Catenovulum sp. TS8]WAJ69900.1 DUF3857 domain-containing protein [Catenovulum sp. TS8]